MMVLSSILLTLWFAALVLDVTLGGMVHLLAATAVLLVAAHRSPGPRHA